MNLIIDPKIFEQNHDLKVGAILIKGMNNGKRVSAVESLLRGICAQRSKEFAEKEIYDNPMVQAWSQAYGKFGINPRKYPPSIAALLKRVRNGKEINHINVLVDIYNYFSLKYLLPIGGEDLDWLCGDLRLTFTKGGEPFRPIGSIEVERANEGEAAYIDDGGITCRYWNYRECERTKFTNKTVNAVLLIEDLSKMHMDEFGKILKEIENTVEKYIGGQIETYILNEENRTLNLGIAGRKHADDSKIPMQEKAHFLKEEAKHEKHENPKAEELKKKQSGKPAYLEIKDKGLLKEQIKALLTKSVKKVFPKMPVKDLRIEYPASENFGDYASNAALHLSKIVGANPREVAQKIIDGIPKNKLLEKVEIAGPGFINFFISQEKLDTEIKKILKEGNEYGSNKADKEKTIVLDYSSPNIAKPLGVHHLLSTIIGQSLYNIFKNAGFKCVSINHIGDYGTQFGKLILAYKKWGNKEIVEKNPIDELLKLYVKFHDEAEKDYSLEDEARAEFKKFEEGDKESHELWAWFVDESMKEINKTYNLLGGIHFDYVLGESFYENMLGEILEEGKKKKVFEIGEEGAYVIKFDDPNIPTVPVQKKDGTTLYITRDFATFKYRMERWKPEKILYVVDVSQKMHFIQLFEGMKKIGWKGTDRGEHIWFGRMSMKEGKMSTRKGNVVLLNEVVEEAISRAGKVLEEKNPELKGKENVSKAVGIGAVKYNILCQNRTTDIVFDWDKMLSLEGNSAPYLQYSYARAKSILRKAEGSDVPAAAQATEIPDAKIKEKTHALISLFPKFSEYLVLAAVEYKPNILCNYLYELAQKFNSFYNTVPVLKVENKGERAYRIKVVQAAAQILRNGLKLLGVEVVEEM